MHHSRTPLSIWLLPLALIPNVFAAPTNVERDLLDFLRPTAIIVFPQATIVGNPQPLIGYPTEEFPGIPYALPPTGDRRLRPPMPITQPMGRVLAQKNGDICPQLVISTNPDAPLPIKALSDLANSPIVSEVTTQSEDCLTLNIHRPPGTKPGDNLPVLFWIFGGGFELGWNSMYQGSIWVQESMQQKQPIIVVTVNYRVAGYGFLGGKELHDEGSTNLGLLDQRLALEWVSDNIGAFGGDPEKVTIWGESAGAISVFDQMAAYDGDNTYKGKPLFRGAIMNSGKQDHMMSRITQLKDQHRKRSASRPSELRQASGNLRRCRQDSKMHKCER